MAPKLEKKPTRAPSIHRAPPSGGGFGIGSFTTMVDCVAGIEAGGTGAEVASSDFASSMLKLRLSLQPVSGFFARTRQVHVPSPGRTLVELPETLNRSG